MTHETAEPLLDWRLVRMWACGAAPLVLGLFVGVWALGGWRMPFVLASGWLAELLVGAWFLKRARYAAAVVADEREQWVSVQIVCLGSGFGVLGCYHLAQGVELPVEDNSLVNWLAAISPVLAFFFVAAAGSLWLSTVLLARLQCWSHTGALAKVLATASLGFIAVVWPLIALQGIERVDSNFFLLGGLGSGASVLSVLFKEIVESKKQLT